MRVVERPHYRDEATHQEVCAGTSLVCLTCGCCWCCEEGCCAEWRCPNSDCGCNAVPEALVTVDGMVPQSVIDQMVRATHPEPYEHEWQAERRAKEMAASTGRPATFWEER